jgi:hypothetical protein
LRTSVFFRLELGISKPHDFWSRLKSHTHDLKSPPTPKTIPSQSYISWYGAPICIHIVSHSQP